MAAHHALLVPVLAAALGWSAYAAGQQPRIRSKSTFVVVDATVLDSRRQPVSGLRAQDFEVRENGKLQVIDTFLEMAAGAPANGPAPELSPGPSLASVASRFIVIVLDDAMLPPDPQILATSRTIAHRILDRMAPHDTGAVVFTQAGGEAAGPSRDRTKLARAVDALRPGFGGGPFAEQASINTLRTVADLLAANDLRATVALIGVGLPIDSSVLTGATPIGAVGDPQGRAGALHRTLLETIALVHRTNASVYTFDAAGTSGMMPLILARNPRMKVSDAFDRARPYREFLEVVAENTGGRAAVNTNSFDAAVDQMLLESGRYYLLGYQSSDPRQDGRYRRLLVRVKKSGLRVHSRSGYWEERK